MSFQYIFLQIATALLGGVFGPCAGVVMVGALFPCVQWKVGKYINIQGKPSCTMYTVIHPCELKEVSKLK